MNASLLEDFGPGANADLHETIFDAIPSPIFVVDSDLRVLDFNMAAATFLGAASAQLSRPHEGRGLWDRRRLPELRPEELDTGNLQPWRGLPEGGTNAADSG